MERSCLSCEELQRKLDEQDEWWKKLFDKVADERDAALERVKELEREKQMLIDGAAAVLKPRDEENVRLREALKGLLNDTQHVDHDCGNEEWCPVLQAKKAVEGKEPEEMSFTIAENGQVTAIHREPK